MSFRKITVKSGDEKFTLEVTEEEYLKYYRPWWSQRKREQRNREAIWVPAEATEGWQIEGKAVVTESTDEFGVKSYSFMDKAAYERRKGCPYKHKNLKGEN